MDRLQYITQDLPNKWPWELVQEACKGGVRWVQLRVKNKSYDEWLSIAMKTQAVCKKYNCRLIINDNVDIAAACQADGVHLGKIDMDPVMARSMIGSQTLIGGTANTFDDIKTLVDKKVDYIGLGPYRFTTTKTKLSPILGLEGYKQIMERCRKEQITTPIVAIGGILKEDVSSILSTGIHGVAVASAIGKSSDIRHTSSEWVTLLKSNDYEQLTYSR